MKGFLIAIGVMVGGTAATATAQVQPGDDVQFVTCSDTAGEVLTRGRRLVVNCDVVFVYTQAGMSRIRVAARNLVAAAAKEKQKYDSLVANLKSLVSVTDSISASKSEVIAAMREIQRVERVAYDSLSRLTDTVRTLTLRSIANTDAALRYINRVQAASYFASALGGGVIGGFASKGSGEAGFNLAGAGIGAGVGLVVNWAVMRVFAR